jgi:hypothetical protein
MSEQQTMSPKELRFVIRLLEKLRDNANHITLTGGLEGGETYLRQQYDEILASLAEQGLSLPRYFPPLPPDAKVGALGVAADQVAESLKELAEPEREGQGASGGSGFRFDFFGGRDFSHIGEAIREAMPDWMQRVASERAAAEAPRQAPPASGSAAAPGAAAPPPAEDRLARLAAIGERMQAVAAAMQGPGLDPEELQRLAAELSELGQQQARLAREAASGSPPPEV